MKSNQKASKTKWFGIEIRQLAWLTIGCWILCDTSWSQESSTQWYRGNLHTHSFWSDGNDFPEMITKWYVDHGYHFLALTDHNVLSQGERWMDLAAIEQRAGKSAMDKYLAEFGDEWVQTREKPKPPVKAAKDGAKQATDGRKGSNETRSEEKSEDTEVAQQVRLRGLEEFRGKYEATGKFLMIAAEEISDRAQGVPVHMNAMNLQKLISPVGGSTVVEAINNNLRAAEEQAKETGHPIMVHLNHPNFGWAVTAEELAEVTNERFFEVYNGHPSINHLGDSTRPGVEKMWDIANTIRIAELKAHPMFGLATDDSHHYHGHPNRDARTGRGWVMVRAKNLSPEALIGAMNAGEFYSSSGVELESVEFESTERVFSLKIKPLPGVTYTTQFVGTRKSYDKSSTVQLDADGKPRRVSRVYSEDVGTVLMTSDALEPIYQFAGDELFVRAVVTSSRVHPNPSFKNQKEQAWTQPVGW